HIRHGATVWLNGQRIADHPVIGPHTILLPEGLLHEGENHILLKVPGWSGIPKAKSGWPLIPVGSGTQSWGTKGTGIRDDIWIEFYDRVYVKWALAMPDVKGKKVTFRVWLDGLGPAPDDVRLAVKVRPEGQDTVVGQSEARAAKGTPFTDITTTIKNAKPWNLQTRHLYTVELRAESAGKVFDVVRFRFGMRQIQVVDGHFRLNGKPLWFRGSNLVCEWHWGRRFNDSIKGYIVDEARVMNLNSFRTHTLPPPTSWVNVGD
ncbi:unnamed protein product, partial [marine sediment metagenome]